MKTISNTDYAAVVDFLREYADTPDGGSLKAFNRRRRARILYRKLSAREYNGRMGKDKT